MDPLRTSVFDLRGHLAPKSDPALVSADEQHFEAIAKTLRQGTTELSDRLDTARRQPGGGGQEALDRDVEVHRLTARLRDLRRFGVDLCLGRTVGVEGTVHIGRRGLTDSGGRALLLDWRAPAAEPFFAATHADPRALTSRRRYRWTRGRITDYWDEGFTDDGLDANPALDDHSAFLASLGGSQTSRMRDVLGTLAAEQDAVIRAGSRGALVVEGGPGTGKTVVALHRAAYLLYSDPRIASRRGGVLVVGPHQPYLAYVADVLPSLGEDSVQTATVADLVAEGARAGVEADPRVARLKSTADMVRAIEAAVRFHEEPPTRGMTVETPSCEVRVRPQDWTAAFDAPGPGVPHNEAREQVWDELLTILAARVGDDPDEVRESLRQNTELRSALHGAWPLVEAAELVGDLWSVPAYLRRCAPWLSPEDVRALQRHDSQAWTVDDLPLLDAARHRLGDPRTTRREQQHAATLAAEREYMTTVVDDLIAADDSELMLMTSLRHTDLRDALVDADALPTPDPDRLAGPFAHVVVDEAQELTDAEWQMLLLRCPARSFTVVGDRAQARHGFTESWVERLARIGIDRVTVATLGVSYRTPEEVMTVAEPVIRAVLPDADVPTSIRRSGVPVVHASVAELGTILDDWLTAHADGIACVIGDPTFAPPPRVRSLTPERCKGLEFDLVVLVDPDRFGDGITGAVDRYVAMTRATRQLVVLTSP